jgi:hypothetical protein
MSEDRKRLVGEFDPTWKPSDPPKEGTKTFYITANLRFVHRVPRGKILQQKWITMNETDIEWRDVPLVDE